MSKRESARIKARREQCIQPPPRENPRKKKPRKETREPTEIVSLPVSPDPFSAALITIDEEPQTLQDASFREEVGDFLPFPQGPTLYSTLSQDCPMCGCAMYSLSVELALNDDQDMSIQHLLCGKCGARAEKRIEGPIVPRQTERDKITAMGVVTLCWHEEPGRALITVFDSEEEKTAKCVRRCYPNNCREKHPLSLYFASGASGESTEMYCGAFTYTQIKAKLQRGELPINKLAYWDETVDPPAIRQFCEVCNDMHIHAHSSFY